MKSVVTVIGKDTTGIIARFSNLCYQEGVNILDITQKVLRDDIFAMIMLTDLSTSKVHYAGFVDKLMAQGKELGLTVHAMHEDVFNSMHRI